MRLAATCVLLAASLTAVVRHHDRPESSSATLVDRPLPARASRGLQRPPLSGRVNTARDSVKARRRLTHGPRHVATSHVLRDQTTVLNWHALARCESSNNPRAVSPDGLYFGLYQFDAETWKSVGGTGNPASASPQEQTYRAELLYRRRGRAPWPVCGRWL